MNIVLIGYRGVGKTSVGKVLAARLGRLFYDTDEYLEERNGQRISDMVAAHGWPFFRAKEKDTIREISAMDNCVIATGGGVVLDEENITALSRNGFLVWLAADIEIILDRICKDSKSAAQRPRFSDCDLVEETKKTLEQRSPIYERAANLRIATGDLPVDAVVAQILAAVAAKK